MNVRCPYCNCCYELDDNLLRNPVGHERLGFGWWLRCYRCHKKWWLKQSEEIVRTHHVPPRADRQAQIDMLHGLVGKRKKPVRRVPMWKLAYPLLFVSLSLVAWVAYSSKEAFRSYITKKAENIAKSPAAKVVMTDVRYTISNNTVNVSGIIKNEDKVIAKIKGVRVAIYSGDAPIKTWDSQLGQDFVLPEDSLRFSVDGQFERAIDDVNNIRVEVSIL